MGGFPLTILEQAKYTELVEATWKCFGHETEKKTKNETSQKI